MNGNQVAWFILFGWVFTAHMGLALIFIASTMTAQHYKAIDVVDKRGARQSQDSRSPADSGANRMP